MIKKAVIAWSILVVLYAPVELSRLIIQYWHRYGMTDPFWLELLWIWMGMAILIYFWIVTLRRA